MIILRGKVFPPERAVIFGPPGVGKSTFACSAPDVVAVDCEDGLNEIGPARVVPAKNWKDAHALIREVCIGPGDHRGVVLDTIDRIQQWAAEDVCREGKKKSLGDFGYGDGYEALATRIRDLLFTLEGAREKGRSVWIVAHYQRKSERDPMLGDYSTNIAALEKKCWSAVHQWADAVLFATYEQGLVDGRAVTTGERVLYTQKGTGFEAKNRWGLPAKLPLDWRAFAEAKSSLQRPADVVIESIRSLAKTDEQKAKAEEYIAKAGADVPRLVAIETALRKASEK